MVYLAAPSETETLAPLEAPTLRPVDPTAQHDAEILDQLQMMDELLVWLASLPEVKPELGLIWQNSDGVETPITDQERLAILVSGVISAQGNDYGVLSTPDTPALFCQIGATEKGGQVDVFGGGDTRYVRRIYVRGAGNEVNNSKPRRSDPWGDVYDDEVFRSAAPAARVMWDWMHCKLTDGYGLRDISPN